MSMLTIILVILAFWAGCLFTEWRSLRKTAHYIEQFNQRAARPNTTRR